MAGPGYWVSDTEGEEPTYTPVLTTPDGDGTYTATMTFEAGVITIHYYIQYNHIGTQMYFGNVSCDCVSGSRPCI